MLLFVGPVDQWQCSVFSLEAEESFTFQWYTVDSQTVWICAPAPHWYLMKQAMHLFIAQVKWQTDWRPQNLFPGLGLKHYCWMNYRFPSLFCLRMGSSMGLLCFSDHWPTCPSVLQASLDPRASIVDSPTWPSFTRKDSCLSYLLIVVLWTAKFSYVFGEIA